MNKKITLSAIDTQITPIIHAIQYDTDRQLECYFEDIDITGVTAARLYALKPDATEVYTDCTLANGYIIAPLDSQTLAVVGTVNCQMQLTINGTLTTFLFNVIVDKSLVSSSAIPSSNEYSALETLIDEAQDVIDGLPAKVSKSGDSMSGNLDMTDNKIVNLGAPTADADAANKEYVDDAISAATVYDNALSDTSENAVQNKVVKSALDGKLSLSGGTMTGDISMGKHLIYDVHKIGLVNDGGNRAEILPMSATSEIIIKGVFTPSTAGDNWATNKKYVDDADALKEDTANKVTGVLDNTATDTQYPSAKSVMDTLLDYDSYVTSTYEALANKVVAIDSQSTDTQYPSAKCVYDAIDAVPVITVDSALDAQSTNPVENGVIVTALGGKESTTNKVTSIDNTSTDTQYASAKCLYDNLALKEDLTNKVTTFSSPTDTEYPSAKLVDDSLALKEDVANKVTSISAASTDTQYPSAKCVYDAIQGGGGGSTHTYSTTEQVVGTWIDGKPIYETTVEKNFSPYISQTETFAHNIANIKHIINADNIFFAEAADYNFKGFVNLDGKQLTSIINTTNITIKRSTNYNTNELPTDVYVTIQYTKTTD